MADPQMALQNSTVTTTTTSEPRPKTGLDFKRYFTDGRVSPFDAVEWERRVAQIGNEKGQVIFRQENVEVPKSWSQTATNIVASKYFHGKLDTPERETSVRQLIGRVVDTIVGWGENGGYFASTASRDAFRDDLTHLLVQQKMSFQFAGVVQRGRAAQAAMLGLLHQLRAGRYGVHHGPGEDRGHAFQVGLRHGHEFLRVARQPRSPLRRRHRLRAGELHEGL